MDVREIALSALDNRNDPALPALSAAQLSEALTHRCDSLGLPMHLKKLSSGIGVPLVVPLLKDTDPQNPTCLCPQIIGGLVGRKFWRKTERRRAISQTPKTGLTVFDEASYRKTLAGVDRAATWWAGHKAEFHSGPIGDTFWTLSPPRNLSMPARFH